MTHKLLFYFLKIYIYIYIILVSFDYFVVSYYKIRVLRDKLHNRMEHLELLINI